MKKLEFLENYLDGTHEEARQFADDLDSVIQTEIEKHHAQFEGEVIHAKALRKKGDRLRFYRYYDNLEQWVADDFVFMFYDETVKGDEFAVNLPKDAELIEIEIRIPQGGGK